MTETETEIAIEESKTTTRTQRFAEWLMARDEKRQEKETSLEGLMKFKCIDNCYYQTQLPLEEDE